MKNLTFHSNKPTDEHLGSFYSNFQRLYDMHEFQDLIYGSTEFTLNALDKTNTQIIEELQTSASTVLVKSLQMIQLQKAIFAIGIFSIFDSILQDQLTCRNGFEEAKRILKEKGKIELQNRFEKFILAINVLKHGHGRSYDTLVLNAQLLPFKIKLLGQNFFEEGKVSEVNTLIEVDNKFVLNCAELIQKVSNEIKAEKITNNTRLATMGVLILN